MKTLTNVQVWLPTDCKVYKVLACSAERDGPIELQIEKSYPVINEEKSKMTREEAIKKIEIIANKGYDAIPAKNLVDALEALGLIKFEEEKKERLVPKYLINEITHIYQYRQYGDIVIIDDQYKGGLEFWIGGRIVYKYHGKEGK